jgi:hypothetical protein
MDRKGYKQDAKQTRKKYKNHLIEKKTKINLGTNIKVNKPNEKNHVYLNKIVSF